MTNKHSEAKFQGLKKALKKGREPFREAGRHYHTTFLERGVIDYDRQFFQFEGGRLIDHIERLTKRSKANGEKAVVVDVGYGMGYFLYDIATLYPNKLNIVGFGTDQYITKPKSRRPNQKKSEYDDTSRRQPLLEENGVRLVNGDVLRIARKLRAERIQPDLIILSQVLQYTTHPLQVLMAIYKALAPNGVAFIGWLNAKQIDWWEAEDIAKEFNKQGIPCSFQAGFIVFRKTKPMKDLDLRKIRWGNLGINMEDD